MTSTDGVDQEQKRRPLRAGAVCALCTRDSTPGGEHVLPQWFLRAAFPDSDEYTTEHNGAPILKEDDDTPRTQTSVDRPKLPCCSTCNAALNDRFERQKTVKIGRRLVAGDGRITLSAEEVGDLGIWLLKTLLLLSHPETTSSVPGVKIPSWNLGMVPADLYSWMTTNAPPPDGLSVWLMLRATDEDGTEEPPVITLPVIYADGRETAFQVKMFAIKRIELTLVYHPHWAIEHPLELDGRAVRMWPRTTRDAVDLTRLSGVVPWPVRWVSAGRITFPPGTYGEVELPPIRPGALGALPDVTSVVGRWP